MQNVKVSGKLTAIKAINARSAFDKLTPEKLDKEFAWFVMKNLDSLISEIEILGKLVKEETEEYVKYKEELFDLKVKHSGNSKAHYKGSNNQVPSKDILDQEKFKKDLDRLNTKYDEVIDGQVALAEENQKFLEEKELELDMFMINYDLIPETIQPQIMYNIRDFLMTPDWALESPKKASNKKAEAGE